MTTWNRFDILIVAMVLYVALAEGQVNSVAESKTLKTFHALAFGSIVTAKS